MPGLGLLPGFGLPETGLDGADMVDADGHMAGHWALCRLFVPGKPLE